MRVVRSPLGSVGVDPTGRAPGRGAYVCRDSACLSHAITRGALSRALAAKVPEHLADVLGAALTSTTIPGGIHGQE